VNARALPPLERRVEAAHVRATDTGAVVGGYALRFDTRSEPLTGPGGAVFVEEIAPQALARLREGRDVKFLANHDSGRVLGSTKAGTLILTVDTIGARFELTPPNSPAGQDLVEAVRRGDLDGMSFGFKTRADTWRDGNPPVRVLTDIDLFEISVVAWPAYREAGIAIEQRALDHAASLVAHQGHQQRRRDLDALTERLAALR
jgi:HK97 family phage prohead protease